MGDIYELNGDRRRIKREKNEMMKEKRFCKSFRIGIRIFDTMRIALVEISLYPGNRRYCGVLNYYLCVNFTNRFTSLLLLFDSCCFEIIALKK